MFDSEPGKSFSTSFPTTGEIRKVRDEVCLRGQNQGVSITSTPYKEPSGKEKERPGTVNGHDPADLSGL